MLKICSPWNHQKTKGFLVFPEGKKWNTGQKHWVKTSKISEWDVKMFMWGPFLLKSLWLYLNWSPKQTFPSNWKHANFLNGRKTLKEIFM